MEALESRKKKKKEEVRLTEKYHCLKVLSRGSREGLISKHSCSDLHQLLEIQIPERALLINLA